MCTCREEGVGVGGRWLCKLIGFMVFYVVWYINMICEGGANQSEMG